MTPGENSTAALLAAAWVQISSARNLLVFAIVALVGIAGAAGTVHLYGDLRPEMGELLPAGARSARDIAEVTRRAGGWAEETVILHGADPDELTRFAEALAPKLEAIPDLVDAVEWRFEEERKFFRTKRWLFPAREDLEELDALVAARIGAGKEPAAGAASAEKLAAWIERVRGANPSAAMFDGFRDGAFLREVDAPGGGREWALFLRVRFKGDPQNFPRVHALHREVKLVESAVRAELGGLPGTQTVLGGYVANAVFEHEGLIEDLLLASALVLFAVATVLVLYFGTLKAIPVIVVPIGVGTLVTFGLADLIVGHVNPNTAFLGSIIAGNGVNVTIILFARYAEERRRGAAPEAAVTEAVAQTWLGTLTASLAAGVAYASLLSTSFRGFSQFGLIGGLGMATCWAAAYAVLPAIVLFWERHGDLITPSPKPARAWAMDPLARAIERAPGVFLAGAAIAGIGSAFYAERFLRDPLEWDFSKLRDSRMAKGGADVAWERAIFGAIQDPSIVLAESESEARVIAKAFEERRRADPQGLIGSVVSVATFVPEDQPAKIEVLRRIRSNVPALLATLRPEEMVVLQGNVPPAQIAPFGAADLPPLVRRRLAERDGRLGTPVLVSPAGRLDVWDGRVAQAWAGELRAVPMPRGDVPIASSLLLFSDVIDAITTDGPRAAQLSALGVVLLISLMFVAGSRSLRGLVPAFTVLAVLASGLLLFAGLAGLFRIKLNMLSFIALPITLGIGADYATNMLQRQRAGVAPGDVLRTTGGAVALCSLTTVLGYSSLLVAHNRALQSFGMLADLGEVSCLVAALVLLPAFSLLKRREL